MPARHQRPPGEGRRARAHEVSMYARTDTRARAVPAVRRPRWAARFVALAQLACVLFGVAAASASQPAERRIERFDPRIDTIVPRDATVEVVSDGHDWLEGPLWVKSDRRLLFSDIPKNAVYSVRAGEVARALLHPSGFSGGGDFAGREPGSNGLTLDGEGRLILAQHGDRRIARLEADGTFTTLADRYLGKRLNSPNDVLRASSGALYFTDPPFGLPGGFEDPARELAFSGVYVRAIDGSLRLLTGELRAPNGIALSPDERTLYVSNADASRPVWMAYAIAVDGTLGTGRIFADASPWVGAWPGNPDGLKTDLAGNLFAAGPGGVYVFAPDGTHLGTIRTSVATSNCAFGDEDGATLYITADHAVLRVRLATHGRLPGP